MAASHLPWPADNPADAKVRERRYSLFLDPEPEITTQPSRRDLPLMAHKSNATMLWPRRRNQPVPESSAVDKAYRALLLCAVKGGVSCHQTSYLRFSGFNRSLFFRLRFFITYLTLPSFSLPSLYHGRTAAMGLRQMRGGFLRFRRNRSMRRYNNHAVVIIPCLPLNSN